MSRPEDNYKLIIDKSRALVRQNNQFSKKKNIEFVDFLSEAEMEGAGKADSFYYNYSVLASST